MREARQPSAAMACSSRCSLRPAVGALALAVLLVAGAQVPNALAAPTFTLEDADAALAFPASDTLIALGFPAVGGADLLDPALGFPAFGPTPPPGVVVPSGALGLPPPVPGRARSTSTRSPSVRTRSPC